MRTPAPTGGVLGAPAGVGRVGARYPQGARRIRKAAKPPTAALCAPLQVYDQHHRKVRRHLRHRASDLTSKFRGQVVARLAERQRRFTTKL